MDQVQTILTSSGMRVTANRTAILKLFIAGHKSFNLSGLNNLLSHTIHRVSVYRTLSDLVDAGILNRFTDTEGTIQYHYRVKGNVKVAGSSPRFRCKDCDKVTSLPQLPQTYYEKIMDEGYIHHSSLIFEGICRECSSLKGELSSD